MIERHHTIPISMQWRDVEENIIAVPKEGHKLIHDTQNLPYQTLRKFRERTNGILIPNEFYWWEYNDLLTQYFIKWSDLPKELSVPQINSLLRQVNCDYKLELNHKFPTKKLFIRALTKYIDYQIYLVEQLLSKNN